jgi:dihydrofolate synthase/folylpolyglutamate synthase
MAAYLASILHAAGYRVGRYTQPHLYSYRERSWACGEFVTEHDVVEELSAMEPALAAVERQAADLGPLTTFDVGAAQTFLHFARAGVQLAVVEVGVGGANDATNALEPSLGLIGPIGMDHVATLGPTIAHIATAKAGIMRRGLDVVVAEQAPDAQRALEAMAARVGAQLHRLGQEVSWRGDACGSFGVEGLVCLDGLESPLVGRCQRDNAAMALAAARLLERRGWPVSVDAMRRGLATVSWPGRFQTVVREPLTIVDGAHNEPSARALRQCIEDALPGRSVTLVLGMSAEKDADAFVRELRPIARSVIVTRARHERACDPRILAAIAETHGLQAQVVDATPAAVARAWEDGGADGVALVTGSLFLVGDVLEWLWSQGVEGRC